MSFPIYVKYTHTHKFTYRGDDELLNADFNIFCNAEKKQTPFALCTAEAKYIAATHVAKQALGNDLYLQNWTSTFQPCQPFSPTIKQRFQSHTIQSFIHARNISTLPIIVSMTLSPREHSILFMSTRARTWQTYLQRDYLRNYTKI
jgi:hypothetical protein